MSESVVVIGSGHAGGMSAIMLRKLKYKGLITIIGDENFIPYQRPALSKDFLSNHISKERLFLKPASFFKKHNISIVLNNRVIKIDREKKIIVLENSEIIPYTTAIIATGSTPIKLRTKSENCPLYYLRTISDSEKLKSAININDHIGIIGSGYIGLEIASVASKKKKKVTIIENETRVMSRSSSRELSSFLEAKHKKEGVKILFNENVLDIKKTQGKNKLILKKNNHITTDLVVVGIGIKPNERIALESAIICDNGIVVDNNCVTSDKNILAIGDCTSHPNKTYGINIRLESVHNAVEQAKTAASYIIKNPKPYNQIPWFWSEQYDIKIQSAGILNGYDKTIPKGSFRKEKFTLFYFKDNILIALDAINSPRDFMIGKKLIGYKTKINDKRFTALLN